jgi:hypothetical protein
MSKRKESTTTTRRDVGAAERNDDGVHVRAPRRPQAAARRDHDMGEKVIRAVDEHNRHAACRQFLDARAERVQHFKNRVRERGDDPAEVLIVVLDVDDPFGGALAAALMPAYDWNPIRERGEKPVALGLARREGIQEAIDHFDKTAGATLRSISGLAVVAVAHGAVEVSHG